MSIPAIKAVGIGRGPAVAFVPGSQIHDEILPREPREAGVATRGPRTMRAVSRAASPTAKTSDRRIMKPISTLMKPLRSVDLDDEAPRDHRTERCLRDFCRGRSRRGGRQPRTGRRVSRKVQRRLAQRDRPELRELDRSTAGEVQANGRRTCLAEARGE